MKQDAPPSAEKDVEAHEVLAEPSGEAQLGAWISAFGRMSDAHPDMARILRVVERLQDRPFRTHVVIHGEPGTGKEGLAKLLHRLFHPTGGPLVRANLAGCSSEETRKRLFGTESLLKKELLPQAVGGSLLIDELLALPLDVQGHLHDLLQKHHPADPKAVVVIGLTDGDLRTAVHNGHFRHDLAFRLLRLVLHVPPLRERPHDIAHAALWTCNRILRKFRLDRSAELFDPNKPEQEQETRPFFVEDEVLETLRQYPWPGNFRELEAVLERAVMLYSDGERLCKTDVDAALADTWPWL